MVIPAEARPSARRSPTPRTPRNEEQSSRLTGGSVVRRSPMINPLPETSCAPSEALRQGR